MAIVSFEGTALVLLIILCFGLLVPELFRKLKLPFISALVLVGSVLGPYGFNYVQSNEVIEFFGFLGSAFLMLMAGLEVRMEHLTRLKKRIGIMAIMNGLIPFLVGVAIMRLFGYPWFSAILVGTIFISSSVAIVISSVKSAGFFHKEIGETIVSATILEDIVSLFLLAVILQSVAPITAFPLPIYFLILAASIYVLKKFLPPFAKFFFRHLRRIHSKTEEYEDQMHFVIALLIGVLLYFSGLGVHPIVAAFLVGVLLSDVITSETLFQKIHTIGYGLFVPVFFFIIGMQMNLKILASFDLRNVFMITLIAGLMASKFLSGYWSSRLVKFSKKNAKLFGVASIAQLTTTLAVTYAASTLNIIDPVLVTAIIILTVVTTFFTPIVLNLLAQKTSR